MKSSLKNTYLIIISIFLYSCGAMKTQMWVNADGSGATNIHIDFGETIKQMKSQMGGMFEKIDSQSMEIDTALHNLGELSFESTETDTFNNTEIFDMPADTMDMTNEIIMEEPGESIEEPSTLSIPEEKDFVTQSMGFLKKPFLDTVFTFYEVMPDSLKSKLDKPELLKQISLKVHNDSIKEESVMDLKYSYKNFDEMNEIFRQLAKTNPNAESLNSYSVNNARVDVAKKTIYFDEVDLSKDERYAPILEDKEGIEQEGFDAILDMMGLSQIDLEINLPSKLNKVKGASYTVIDDDTIVVFFKIKDFLKKGKIPAYEVSYK
jgi:hypothetical protein